MDIAKQNLSQTRSKRSGLLKHQLHLVKRKDCDRYEVASIPDPLSFEKGFFMVVRACQLLAQKVEGVILVGLAGPSGAGKTIFTEKLVNFMPSIAAISMDNYNDSSRLIDDNYDDPRLTDYDLLLEHINDLKAGKPIQVPVYDFKLSRRVGHRNLEVPASRIVILEGIYALSEKLEPLLDLRVAITGGVHFDLVKRVLRDINRAGQEPEDIISQISETVYPMYKAFIEPALERAHIKVVNNFNPFSGFQNPSYILKSAQTVTEDQIREVLSSGFTESLDETYDIYLLPPGEDPETCQSYLRMRNRDGKYCLIFEEWVSDNDFIISPRITFEASVRLLGGLMALGYTIAAILKRTSQIFSTDKLCIKIDRLEQLQRKYIQVQGKDRMLVAETAKKLGLDGSYIPRSYIEQIQLEKLTSEMMALSKDLKVKLSINEDMEPSPRVRFDSKHDNRGFSKSWTRDSLEGMSRSVPPHNQQSHRSMTRQQELWISRQGKNYEERALDSPASNIGDQGQGQIIEQISGLNERLDEITKKIAELGNKVSNPSSQIKRASSSGVLVQGSNCVNGMTNSAPLPLGVSNPGMSSDTILSEEIKNLTRGQRHLVAQVDTLGSLLHEYLRLNPPTRSELKNKEGILDSLNSKECRRALIIVGLCVGVGFVTSMLRGSFKRRQ